MREILGTTELFNANARLNDAEYAMQRLHLQSMPRYLTLVLGNLCNLNCIHCYQLKNGDNLLLEPKIGHELRREFASLYPFLSTLRIQGGEVFALRGFRELIEDVQATVDRPLISISTNGVLVDDEWAERMVRIPFQSVTFSIDGGTAATFERLRRGARWDTVIENIKRIQSLKSNLDSPWPRLDAFFVLMRSNYREIPQFMELLKSLAIDEVAFQIMLVDNRNLDREPTLQEEVIQNSEDVRELHEILQTIKAAESGNFRRISWSGLHMLFEQHGLDPSFLDEETGALYPGHEMQDGNVPPGSQDNAGNGDLHEEHEPSNASPMRTDRCPNGKRIALCPNPWSMLQVSENGDVSLCFLSDPIGNIYQMPLAKIWNHPKAIAQRSEMISGRYLAGGCSRFSCSWREGKSSAPSDIRDWIIMLQTFKETVRRIRVPLAEEGQTAIPGGLAAVRRLLQDKDRRIQELEASLASLWEKNGYLHSAGQAHIDYLESKIRDLTSHSAQPQSPAGRWDHLVHFPASWLKRLSAKCTRWMKR